MDNELLTQSLQPGGQHYFLSALAGHWQGMARTWFEPDVLADESPVQATLHTYLDGRFLILEELGTLIGHEMRGRMTIGYNLLRGRYEVLWLNNLHNSSAAMYCIGQPAPGGFSVIGSYAVPGNPDWGWRIELILQETGDLFITHYNITPTGQESKGVEMVYRKTG